MTEFFQAGPNRFPLDRTYLMGIVNTTPDSFSDGGRYLEPAEAVRRGKQLLEEGADILDIGGESTRPGFTPVPWEEELRRVLPVVKALSPLAPVSIDTTKYEVAEAALEAGACLINDIWGFVREPRLAELAARTGAGAVLMHNREEPAEDPLWEELKTFFHRSVKTALEAGMRPEQLCLDPGVGFGKTYKQNLEAINCIDRIRELGYPVLLGVSRKSVVGLTLEEPVDRRLEGTLACGCVGIVRGASFLRVHDVLANRRAARMTDAILRGDRQ